MTAELIPADSSRFPTGRIELQRPGLLNEFYEKVRPLTVG